MRQLARRLQSCHLRESRYSVGVMGRARCTRLHPPARCSLVGRLRTTTRPICGLPRDDTYIPAFRLLHNQLNIIDNLTLSLSCPSQTIGSSPSHNVFELSVRMMYPLHNDGAFAVGGWRERKNSVTFGIPSMGLAGRCMQAQQDESPHRSRRPLSPVDRRSQGRLRNYE